MNQSVTHRVNALHLLNIDRAVVNCRRARSITADDNTHSWGSIISGQRVECCSIVAFSVDMPSMGSPSLFQVAICASSDSSASGSTPCVCGIWGYFQCKQLSNCASRLSASSTHVHLTKARQPHLVLQLLAIATRKAAHVRQERGN